jgi:cytidylate kinase
MIIAVDGPTASGKGTIAKAIAAHFGLPHLKHTFDDRCKRICIVFKDI